MERRTYSGYLIKQKKMWREESVLAHWMRSMCAFNILITKHVFFFQKLCGYLPLDFFEYDIFSVLEPHVVFWNCRFIIDPFTPYLLSVVFYGF